MATTFKTLADAADWSHSADGPAQAPPQEVPKVAVTATTLSPGLAGLSLRHDIHVHLPATSDVAVYRAIFRALRDELT
jgi:hypothetical protein